MFRQLHVDGGDPAVGASLCHESISNRGPRWNSRHSLQAQRVPIQILGKQCAVMETRFPLRFDREDGGLEPPTGEDPLWGACLVSP